MVYMPSAFRRRLLASLVASLLAPGLLAAPTAVGVPSYRDVATQVVPEQGHQSLVSLGDSIVSLTRAGVIDRKKIEAIYAQGGGSLQDLGVLFDEPSRRPIRLTRANAHLYVNLLWPLGLANRMASNSSSPVNGPSLMRFASTGGWTLGREPNGGLYFNKFPIVELTAQQEALVVEIAKNSFRPCCNNSTFFQDCNHGSALLGMLALGAAQGLDEADLYREALAFNSFWFPEHMTQMALYFKVAKGIDWADVDPKTALSAAYSSASGIQTNVIKELSGRGLIPAARESNCSA